jgi:hypothetical protein
MSLLVSQLDNAFETPLTAICLVDFHDVKRFISETVHLFSVLYGGLQPNGYLNVVVAISTAKSHQSLILLYKYKLIIFIIYYLCS